VKSLALFQRILRMLDANLEWSEQLGEAYLADPAALMDAVQRSRALIRQRAGRRMDSRPIATPRSEC